jgi:epoxyqueuosine reductase
VCPWNRFSAPHQEPRFNPLGDWPQFSNQDWKELTEEIFKKNFSNSAITRTGFKGLKRNIEFNID